MLGLRPRQGPDGVDDHVILGARLNDLLRTVINHVICTQTTNHFRVPTATDCCDMCAEMFGDLHAGRTDRPRGPVNQNRFARLQLGLVHKKVVGRGCAKRDRSCLFEADVVRLQGQFTISRHGDEFRMCPKPCTRKPDHGVAGLIVRNFIAHCLDHTREFGAKDRLAGASDAKHQPPYHTKALWHRQAARAPISCTNGRGVDADQNLVWFWRWRWEFNFLKHAWRAVFLYEKASIGILLYAVAGVNWVDVRPPRISSQRPKLISEIVTMTSSAMML